MSNLNFLEINENFKSYYQTLRDANYYFRDRPELQGTNQIIAELLLNFIGMNGTTFREMNPAEYERDYRMFEDDFLDVIENSALNNLNFQTFSGLIDEIISVAHMRSNALQKINRRTEEDFEIIIVPNEDELPNDASEIYVTISDGDNPVEEDDEESLDETDQYLLDAPTNDEEEMEEKADVINEILLDEDELQQNDLEEVEAAVDASTANQSEGQTRIRYRYENS